ncbi:uncharacterized protein METZ01_LOCUS266281, partial [marine metagenome]
PSLRPRGKRRDAEQCLCRWRLRATERRRGHRRIYREQLRQLGLIPRGPRGPHERKTEQGQGPAGSDLQRPRRFPQRHRPQRRTKLPPQRTHHKQAHPDQLHRRPPRGPRRRHHNDPVHRRRPEV